MIGYVVQWKGRGRNSVEILKNEDVEYSQRRTLLAVQVAVNFWWNGLDFSAWDKIRKQARNWKEMKLDTLAKRRV